jgi:hypothetical protein
MAETTRRVTVEVVYKKAGDPEVLREVQRIRAEEAKMQDENRKLASSYKAVVGSVKEMHANMRTLQASLQGLRSSTGQISQADREHAEAIRRAIFEQRQAIQVQNEMEKKNRAGYASIGRIIRQFLIWRVAINTIMTTYTKLVDSLKEGFQAVYENTEEYKRLAEAKERARNALILLLAPQEQVKEIMGDTAGFLERLSEGFINMRSALGAFVSLGTAIAEEGGFEQFLGESVMGTSGKWGERVGRRFGELEAERMKQQGTFDEYLGEYNRLRTENNRLLDQSIVKEEKERDITKDLIRLTRQWDEELKRHQDRIREIARETATTRAESWGTYFADVIKINQDLADAIAKIEKDALKARDKALDKFNKARKKAEQNANDDLERMQAEHDMQMRHAREAYRLSVLQGERMYQYERGMLVAEGDVLALEDLDARYQLEQQAQQENFELQQRQQEEMFQLQLKYQKEAMREMIADLKDALAEQLADIEENKRERIAEEEAAAQRERERAAEEHRIRLEKAKAEGIELLALEDERHREAKEKAAQGLADLASENELGLSKVTAAWRAVYGPDGELDRMTDEFYREQEAKAAQFRASLGTAGGGGSSYGGRPPLRMYQYGGEFIASKPTQLLVGEGRAPERVVVEPLSFAGGNVYHSWRGPGIPVSGSGLGGANTGDVQAAFNTFARHLVSSLSGSLAKMRGRRGY